MNEVHAHWRNTANMGGRYLPLLLWSGSYGRSFDRLQWHNCTCTSADSQKDLHKHLYDWKLKEGIAQI